MFTFPGCTYPGSKGGYLKRASHILYSMDVALWKEVYFAYQYAGLQIPFNQVLYTETNRRRAGRVFPTILAYWDIIQGGKHWCGAIKGGNRDLGYVQRHTSEVP